MASTELHCRDPSFQYSLESNLILGCSSLAGLYTSTTEETAEETVLAAINAGFLLFDTAPHYGCGLGEERLGRAIKNSCTLEKLRNIKIWSKVGRLMIPITESNRGREIDTGNIPGSKNCAFPDAPRNVIPVFDYSSDGVIRSYADSMKRMGFESLHGLRIHDCENEESIAAVLGDAGNTLNSGGLSALVEMRLNAKIRDVSLGVKDAASALAVLRGAPTGSFDSIMIAGCWNLLEHSSTCLELLLECQRRSIPVHNCGVFASGLLVGGSTYRYAEASVEEKQRTAIWTALCEEYGVPLPAVALKFSLLPSIVEASAVGVKSPSEVSQLVEWFSHPVPYALLLEAKRRGLIEPHVPF
jgi:D-threo-aldose 1-dehydrogenase